MEKNLCCSIKLMKGTTYSNHPYFIMLMIIIRIIYNLHVVMYMPSIQNAVLSYSREERSFGDLFNGKNSGM